MTVSGDNRWKLKGRVVTAGVDLANGWVTVDGTLITGVGSGDGPSCPVTADLGDFIIAPGFVDLHVHGANGYQFGGESRSEVVTAAREVAIGHAAHGTTTLMATTISEEPERLRMIVSALGSLVGTKVPCGAQLGGIHMEGPWLAPTRTGAHDPLRLRPPDAKELESLIEASGKTIRLVTYAPELDRDHSVLNAGLNAGIVMSVGHTEADWETVLKAFAAGASHVTHLGNAMAALDRRAPGPIAAALETAGVTLEVIADGIHVHPGFLSLLAHLADDRLIAVTDAVAGCGMPEGTYRLGDQEIVVHSNSASLASDPGVLAGSVLTMDRAVAMLCSIGMSLQAAITTATATPAARAGMPSKGHLRPGGDADIVVLRPNLAAAATVVCGSVAWDPMGLLDPLGTKGSS